MCIIFVEFFFILQIFDSFFCVFFKEFDFFSYNRIEIFPTPILCLRHDVMTPTEWQNVVTTLTGQQKDVTTSGQQKGGMTHIGQRKGVMTHIEWQKGGTTPTGQQKDVKTLTAVKSEMADRNEGTIITDLRHQLQPEVLNSMSFIISY